jgi:hypothetical protein
MMAQTQKEAEKSASFLFAKLGWNEPMDLG